ncbi:hypothetical protein [Agromyces albus]|uniref:hypothetical protein n=1 Tax=Agromyces albus TaxID=205332 RepID=UPI002786FE1D|nr:hypothetical protein [Agromyces albus]MDQ0577126.1 hypothetical protein [Agromyces albus]
MSDLEEPKPGVSRRTVAKAMAWSVPAVALAVPTPAYAASPGVITVTGAGCKLPGASQNAVFKGYAFRATISNTTNTAITVTIVDMTLDGDDLGNVGVIRLDPCTDLGTNTFTVAANSTFDVALLTQNAATSANGQLIISYTVDGGPVQQVSTDANASPPIQGASCTAFSDSEQDCIVSEA